MTDNRKAVGAIQSGDTVTEFEVIDGGTLRVSHYTEAKIRAEFYCDVADSWSGSSEDLADAMSDCEPLAWAVHEIYSDCRLEIEAELQDVQEQLELLDEEDIEDAMRQRLADLQARLDGLPEEPEEGAVDWLLNLSSEEFAGRVMPQIESWFSEAPNWNFEDDYLPETSTAQGAALEFFRDMSNDDLETLGIDIVEGDRPGSTYYAAELRGDLEAANRAAEVAGIPVRFVMAKH